MRRRFLVIMLLTAVFLWFLNRYGQAIQTTLWISSNTATADTTQNICQEVNPTLGTSGSGGSVRCFFHGICINTSSPGTLSIFNSSGTSTGIIATVSTSSAVPCNFYDVAVSSGLTYTKTGVADITILFQRL